MTATAPVEALLSDYLFLNTRPRRDNTELTRRLRNFGGSVVEIPFLGFEGIPVSEEDKKTLSNLCPDDCLIFTSANGVGFFSEELVQLMRGANPRIAVIGEKTAEALKPMELVPDFMPTEANSQGFLKEFLAQENKELRTGRIVLVRGESATRNLPEGLLGAGLAIEEIAVYRSIAEEVSPDLLDYFLKAAAKKLPILCFYSGLTVKAFSEIAEAQGLAEEVRRIPAAVIGPETAKSARDAGFSICLQSSRANTEVMVEDLIKWTLS